jgi:hypothetical protein
MGVMNMYCGNCGSEIPSGSTFCGVCGEPVVQDEPIGNQNEPIGSQKKYTVLCIILTVLAVLFGFTASMVVIARKSIDESAIRKFVKSIDISDIDAEFIKGSNADTLSEYICDVSWDEFGIRLSESDVEEILDEDYVRDFLSDKIDDYIDDLLYETGDGSIDVDELIDFLEKNNESFAKITGYYFKAYDFDNMEDSLRKPLKSTRLSNYRDDYETGFKVVRNLLSYGFMAVMLVLAVICAVVIVVLSRPRSNSLFNIGASFGIIGLLDFAVVLGIGNMAHKFNKVWQLGTRFWQKLLSPMKSAGIVTGLVLLLIGVILLVAGCVWKYTRKNNV